MNEENKNVENLTENTEVLQPSEPVTETLIEVETLSEEVKPQPEVMETETVSTEVKIEAQEVIENASEPISEAAPVEPVVINSETPTEAVTEAPVAPVEVQTEAPAEVIAEPSAPAAPVEPAAPAEPVAPTEPAGPAPEGETAPVEPVPATTTIEPKKKGKGGLILIIIAVLALIGGGCYYFLVLNNSDNGNSNSGSNKENNKGGEAKNTKSLKDIKINGKMCLNDDCTFTITSSELTEETDFKISDKRVELFEALYDYSEQVKIDIDYTDGKEKTITNFTVYDKNSNEKIDAKTESDLRNSLGLHNEGTYTEEYTFKSQSDPIMGFSDDEAYQSIDLELEDSNGNILNMSQKFNSGEEIATYEEGSKYSVTFEVKKGSFGYEYNVTEMTKQ